MAFELINTRCVANFLPLMPLSASTNHRPNPPLWLSVRGVQFLSDLDVAGCIFFESMPIETQNNNTFKLKLIRGGGGGGGGEE